MKPYATGSPTWVKTIGIVLVASLAARVAGERNRDDQVDI